MKPRSRSNFEHSGAVSVPSAKRPRIFRSQSGQSLVELALLTPILLLMLIGIVEMGRYSYLSLMLASSARAGASYGAQGVGYSVDCAAGGGGGTCASTSGIYQAAYNDFYNSSNNTNNTSAFSVTANVSCGCDSAGAVTAATCTGTTAGTCGTGHWVILETVTVSAKFSSLFSYPGIPSSLTVTDTETMRVKQD